MKKALKIVLLSGLALSFFIFLTGCDISAEDQADGEVESVNENIVDENSIQSYGAEGHGFFSAPGTWSTPEDFQPEAGEMKFTDGAGSYITLDVLEKGTDPKNALSGIAAEMEQGGAVGVASATDSVNGIDAYQVYGHFEQDGIYVVHWMFEGSDGKVHHLKAEGSQSSIMEPVELIRTSFSLSK